MELIKFRRQYLITSKEVAELDGWQKETLNGMNVYAEQSLQMHKRNIEDREFLLLGYWINPHSPEKDNSDIMEDMVVECDTFESVLHFLYPLSGRFALFCKFGDKAYGVSDAGGFRPIFYNYDNDSINITSNIFLLRFVTDLKEKSEKYLFEHSNYYKLQPTYDWCPGYTFYEDVVGVPANHYINISDRAIMRFYPYNKKKNVSGIGIEQNLKNINLLIGNSIRSLASRVQLSFSLTAGYDSRLLLSTIKDISNQMYFWISYNSKKERDYFLPAQILQDVGLNRNPIKNKKRVSKSFRDFYIGNTPMAHPIWQKYYGSMVGYYPDNYTVIRGSTAAVFKNSYYGSDPHPEKITTDFFRNHEHMLYLKEDLPDLNNCFKNYLEEVQEACNKYDYKTLDFWEWEYDGGGQWQAQSQLESDFLHDVFVPLSNREIIDLFLQLPDEYRDPKEMKAYKEIIKIGWPELLNYPFNPLSKYSKFELKMQYYKEAAKFKLRKMFGK